MMLANSSMARKMSTRSVSSAHWSRVSGSVTTPRWFSSVPTETESEEKADVPVAEPPTAELSELKKNLKPSEIVTSLDRHIVGQQDAKKAVAIAMRNRWRRRQLPDELRKEVTPRNVLLVGPTGGFGRILPSEIFSRIY